MSEPNAAAPRSDWRFLYAAGALLLVIIALLGALWLTWRNRALLAERRAALAEGELAALRRDDQGGRILLEQLAKDHPLTVGVRRETLATRPAVVDGREVTALRLSAEMGEALGLLPGDVVLVDALASTAPATAPAVTAPSPGGP